MERWSSGQERLLFFQKTCFQSHAERLMAPCNSRSGDKRPLASAGTRTHVHISHTGTHIHIILKSLFKKQNKIYQDFKTRMKTRRQLAWFYTLKKKKKEKPNREPDPKALVALYFMVYHLFSRLPRTHKFYMDLMVIISLFMKVSFQ